MAEFLNQPPPQRLDLGPDQGFNAMGKPVPISRRSAALEQCRQMGLTNTEDAWNCVGEVARQLERDQPYEAMKAGMQYLDLTGTYRLFAYLLCD